MIRRGSWVPLLPRAARERTVRAVPIIMLGWGLDYSLPGVENAHSLSKVEQAMPMGAWGALCLIGGIATMLGFYGRWRRLTIAGLWVAGWTFTAIAVGQWWAVSGVPWLDGVRGPIVTTIVGLAQINMAFGYAQQPSELEGEP